MLTDRMLNHHIPLDPKGEREAHLTLPALFTSAEAVRLIAFIDALAFGGSDADE